MFRLNKMKENISIVVVVNISSKKAEVSRIRRTDSQTEQRHSYGSGRRCPIPYYCCNMTETESSSQH